MSAWASAVRRTVWLVVVPLLPLSAQGGGDLSRQPYVIQRLHRTVRYEQDGRATGTVSMRAAIQSQAALRWFGQLTFPYSSENQDLTVDRVVVLKAGGDTIRVPATAVQDLSGPVAQEAPMYSDLRQRVVTVPSVQPGDTVEYQVTWTTRTSLGRGEFWDAVDFSRVAVVLDERLTYDLPRPRKVQVRTEGGPAPQVTESGDRILYEWRRTNLVPDTTTREESTLSRAEHHGARLTTFADWAGVGAWYGDLERDRETVTPEIRRRAEALVAGRTTLRDSIAALYDFVSTQVRYVSLEFGIGRYQPHQASEVLANEYGDCKDKHVLLAALLRAIGVRSAPVLIPSEEPIDPALPSPLQFDHLITLVELGKDSLWLDATPGVAPFGFLQYNLRGKQGLVIPDGKTAALARTPVAPPFPTFDLVELSGSLDETGRIDAVVRYESRGDLEVLLRGVMRQVPENRWPLVAQQVAKSADFKGSVTGGTATDPIATREPFAFTFRLEQPGAVSWSNLRADFSVPLPDLEFAETDTGATGRDSIPIGMLDVRTHRLRLVLPAGVSVRIPTTVKLTRDYAEYVSSTERRGDTLVVERTVRFTRRFLPRERNGDFAAFRRVLDEDQDRTLTFNRTTAPPAAAAAAANANTDALHETGMQAIEAGDGRGAVRAFRRVVELAPRHQYAWNNLGRAYLMLGKLDSAEVAFRKQIEINPFDQWAHNNLGLVLRREGRKNEAAAAFRKQIEVNPVDQYAYENLGRLLVDMHQDSAAASALEQAVSVTPNDTALYVLLGSTYLRLNRGSDALGAFQRAVALSPTPEMWNNVAYSLAEQRVELDTAEVYARRAIDATEAILRDFSLEDAGMREVLAVNSLGSYWDTMGWIYFGRGELAKAERYVRAAWLLNERSLIGEHLGQIQVRLGKSSDAIHTYALAMHGMMPSPTLRGRLVKQLGGSEREADRRIELARQESTKLKTVRLANALGEDVSGQVQLLIAPGPSAARVEDVRVVSGSGRLERLKPAIRAAKVDVVLPEPDSSIKLVRNAIVTCSSTGGCALVMMPMGVVRMGTGSFEQQLR